MAFLGMIWIGFSIPLQSLMNIFSFPVVAVSGNELPTGKILVTGEFAVRGTKDS